MRTDFRVDVTRQHAGVKRLGGGDRQHAGSRADVENAARATILQQNIQRQQAPAGGAVMPGAEGERRLDLDTDPIRRHGCAVVGTVHGEAAGENRLQPGEARCNPILRRDRLEGEAGRAVRSRDVTHRQPDRRFIWRRFKVHFEDPVPAGTLERRRLPQSRNCSENESARCFAVVWSQTSLATLVCPAIFIG